MSDREILETLAKLGAIITNTHVVYTSGRHGNVYVNKDAIYPFTHVTSNLCQSLAMRFKTHSVDAVIAPVIGGVILSQWVSYHLSSFGKNVLALYAEKDPLNNSFVIKRGYDKHVPGKKILVVEDVLTTGGSVKKVIQCIESLKGNIVGVGVLCNRGGLKASDFGPNLLLHSLMDISLESWDETNCPLCRKGVPINSSVGKGSK